ncbi:MAG: acyl carrier protein [Polyangiales bacterium]
MDATVEKLTEIFKEVFDLDALTLRDDMVAADVEEWDSLNHVKLVLAIESGFGVKFSTREIAGWKNVGDMTRTLRSKLSA